jgi:hypothetical protein
MDASTCFEHQQTAACTADTVGWNDLSCLSGCSCFAVSKSCCERLSFATCPSCSFCMLSHHAMSAPEIGRTLTCKA